MRQLKRPRYDKLGDPQANLSHKNGPLKRNEVKRLSIFDK